MRTGAPGKPAGNFFAIGAGLLLIASFFSLGRSVMGLQIRYSGPVGFIGPGELDYWFGYTLLLTPGFVLFCFGFRQWLTRQLLRIKRRVDRFSRREWLASLLALTVVFFVVSQAGHFFVLDNYPITDDEYGAMLGGQVLASGRFAAPVWEPLDAYKHPFMFIRDGYYTSMEYPGVVGAWALSEVSGLGPSLWAAFAALPVAAVACAAARGLGYFWGLAAGLLFALSPAVLTLSMTTHAHLLSRAFCALALFFFAVADADGELRFGPCVGFGLCAGLGGLCRPLETAFLLTPVFLSLLWGGRARPLRVLSGVVLGVLGPLGVYAAYNFAVTGSAFMDPHMMPAFKVLDFPGYEAIRQSGVLDSFTLDSLWAHWGGNASYNLLCVIIWFSSPLLFPLVMIGAGESRFARAVGLGLLGFLGLALFHRFAGIHSVGPINYSECEVGLALLAAFGLRRLLALAAGIASGARELVVAGVAGAVASSFVFTASNLSALHAQAGIHDAIYGFVSSRIEEARGKGSVRKAVVLAARYADYWMDMPQFRPRGSFVYEWRIPRPDLSDPVLYLIGSPENLGMLRKKFPDRDFFRLTHATGSPSLGLDFLPPRS